MKAVVLQNGSIDFSVQEVETPEVRKNDVLIKVKAFAINRVDLLFRDRWLESTETKPQILGTDAAGIVHEIGAEVTKVSVGDRILINPGLSCLKCRYCLMGEQSQCDSFGIMGYGNWGGAAEFVRVPAANVLRIPDNLSFELAAATPLTTLTVYRMLYTKAQTKPGEIVLVLGAGGGIGTIAIQMAKFIGARVIALTSTQKVEEVKKLGADLVIDYEDNSNWDQEILKYYEGVDVTIDPVGEATWEKSLAVLTKGGRHVVIGATTGSIGSTQIRQIYAKQAFIMGSYMSNNKEFEEAMELVFSGKIKPVIDSVHPMDKLGEGINKMVDNDHIGKLVFRTHLDELNTS